MKQFKNLNLKTDILSGIIVALVSIPISMGYAQVAGLPVVYGLYGSVLPVLVYALLTSSPQFVFGVDATPAALVGGGLAGLGIAQGSDEAIAIMPVITMLTTCGLLLFLALRAGMLVKCKRRVDTYILWNARTNDIYEVSIPSETKFLDAVAKTVTKRQVKKYYKPQGI